MNPDLESNQLTVPEFPLAAAAGIALLLAGTAAMAADWYWRPYEGTPGGDGRSYATAWRGEAAVDWRQLRPGDRLYYCGTHDVGYQDRQVVVGTDGIILTGECPGDPGRLISTGDRLDKRDWRLATPGELPAGAQPAAQPVYVQAYGGSSDRYVLSGSLDRVPVVAPRVIASAPCPAFAFDRAAGLAWYRPCGAPDAIYTSSDEGIVIRGRRNVTVRGLAVLNAGRGIAVYDSTGIDLQPDVRFAMLNGVALGGRTSNGRIHDGDIRDAGNGIYGITGTTGSHDGWIIERNRIYRISGSDDAHGIGWQHGSDNVFRGNVISQVGGTGITLYVFRTGTLNRNVIDGNEISNVDYEVLRGNLGRGIEIGGDNCPGEAFGNRIEGNRLRNMPGPAMYLKVRRPGPGQVPLTVRGNTVENAGAALVRNVGPALSPAYATIGDNPGMRLSYAGNAAGCGEFPAGR